jgi:mannose-6-phosphate isomerase-like protein (cupin superfamily)
MKPYKTNIEKMTLQNKLYRKILYTSPQQQLVLMKLKPNEEIGMEKHVGITQFIRVEGGSGIAIIRDKKYLLKDGDAIIIPSNTYHNIIAKSEGLQLYTLYSPPAH